jgi:hypothetical protein
MASPLKFYDEAIRVVSFNGEHIIDDYLIWALFNEGLDEGFTLLSVVDDLIGAQINLLESRWLPAVSLRN